MTCDLTDPIFTNEAAAVAHMEQSRWADGVSCPLCGAADEATKMGGNTQAGMFQCNACRGKFSVRTGTVFERSHIPLHKWLLATHLMAASKKGVSAHQLHRMLGITYKSAWFMAHRIREAMKPAVGSKIGGEGKIVEADETYVTNSVKTRKPKNGKEPRKQKIMSVVERGGETRSAKIESAEMHVIKRHLVDHMDPASTLHTDGAQAYKSVVPTYAAAHEWVDHHSGEYVRKLGNGTKAHTNTLEGYFSVFKRGMVGIYQHVGDQHLDRYLAEFDFRQNNRIARGVNDNGRAARILKGAEGKRLTYRQVS